MSIATCGKCGAAWNVAGLAGVASIPCQRCGAVIPLASAPPQPWAQLAAGGAAEGILASPLPQGTPVSDNAIQCPSCGTVLDAAGLAVGTTLRCGRCQKTFPRPAPFAGQPTMAVPAGSPDPGGDLTLELKETFRCDHCGREYYEEELPEPDEKRQIRCKKCGRVMRDLAEEEEEDEEDDEGAEKADRGKPKKERGELRGLGRRRRGLGRGGKRKGKREPEPPPPPQKVILDEKFKTDVMNFFRAGDEDAALERCMKLVDGREKQARQIYDHLHKIAKSKNWIGTAKPKPPLAAPKPAPPPRPTPPPVAVPAPPPTPPPAPPPMIRHQQATLLAASQPPPGAAPAPSAPTGLREGGPQIGGASPGFGPSRYKPPGLGVRTSGPNLAEAQAQTFGTPTAPLGASQAPPPSVTPAPAPPPLAPLPPLQPASSQGSLPPAFAPPAATAPTAHFPPPVRREEPPAPPSEEEGLEDLPPSPENLDRVPGPAGEETVIEDAPVLELAEEVDPQEEGFISRIALEGRLAQLEVLVGSRRFTAARDLSRALAAHESKNAHAHWLLAEALAGLGDDDGAFDAAQKAARLAPTDARAVRAYAQALSRKGKLPEACLAMRRIVGTAKGEPRDSVFLADLLRRQGEEAHAKKIMEELVARDPQSLEPMRQASLARAAAGDLEGAADELESLSKKEKPPRPITLAVATELARAVEAAGDRAPPSAVVGCARALDASGKTIAAVRLLGPLVLRDPGAIDARRALGLAYSKLGAAPLAEEHLRAVASRPGAGADECKALGELALERGDAEGAVRVLVRARDLRPDDVSIRRALARAHEAAGEFQKALEEIEVACTDAPDDKDLDAIHEALSERALAAKLTALEARVREAPDDTQAWLDLGIALFEKGEASRAFDSLAKAVRDPYLVPRVVELVEFLREELDDQRPAVVLLVELHRKAQSPQKAIEVLEAFLKEHTDDGLRLELLELYWKGKRIPAAVEGLLAVLGKAEKDRLPPAIALAEKVLESESQNDLARAIARAKRKTGDLAGAARAFEKYLEAVPGDREARRELASALEDGLNIEEALAALRPLVQDGVPTPDELSYAASLMVHLEKHAEAVPLLKRALELRPDDRGMKERLERAEGAVRDREAERLAAQVRKAGASASEDDCRRLASLYAESGKQKEALELLRVLPGIPAGDDEAVFLRFQAEQLARSGRIDKAEAALRQLCKVLAYVPGSEQEKTMLYRIASLYERSNDRRSARRVYLELVGRDPNYRDAYSKLEAQAEAGAAVESEAALEERRFADLIETGAPRDLKTIFDALGGMDLALDATLLADARAKLSAGAQSE